MFFKNFFRRGTPSSVVDRSAEIGTGVKIWTNVQVLPFANVGAETTLGAGVFVGAGVRIGSNCKIQSNALLYEPAILESGVFIGPGAILTNDRFPRATRPDGMKKTRDDWERVGVVVREGASIGAGAICVAPIEIGRWAVVAAGATVIEDVLPYSLVAGVPAVQIGWVCDCGKRLRFEDDLWRCPESGLRYRIEEGRLMPLGDGQ